MSLAPLSLTSSFACARWEKGQEPLSFQLPITDNLQLLAQEAVIGDAPSLTLFYEQLVSHPLEEECAIYGSCIALFATTLLDKAQEIALWPYEGQVLFFKSFALLAQILLEWEGEHPNEKAPLAYYLDPTSEKILFYLNGSSQESIHLKQAQLLLQMFLSEGIPHIYPPAGGAQELRKLFVDARRVYEDPATLPALESWIQTTSQNFGASFFLYWAAELLYHLAPTGLFSLYQALSWKEEDKPARYQLNELSHFLCASPDPLVREKATLALQESQKREPLRDLQAQLTLLLVRKEGLVEQGEKKQALIQAEEKIEEGYRLVKKERLLYTEKTSELLHCNKELLSSKLLLLDLQREMEKIEESQALLEKEVAERRQEPLLVVRLQEEQRNLAQKVQTKEKEYALLQKEIDLLQEKSEEISSSLPTYSRNISQKEESLKWLYEEFLAQSRAFYHSLQLQEKYLQETSSEKQKNIQASSSNPFVTRIPARERALFALKRQLFEEKKFYSQKWGHFEKSYTAFLEENLEEGQKRRAFEKQQELTRRQDQAAHTLQSEGPFLEEELFQQTALEKLSLLQKRLEIHLARQIHTQKPSLALPALEDSLNAHLYRSQGNCYYGMAHFQSGKERKELLAKAILYLQKALFFTPQHQMTCKDLANAYLDFHLPRLALTLYETPCMKQTEFASAYFFLVRAKAYLELGQHDKGLKDLDRFIQEEPHQDGFSLGYCLRGLLYEKKGHYFAASSDYIRAFVASHQYFSQDYIPKLDPAIYMKEEKPSSSRSSSQRAAAKQWELAALEKLKQGKKEEALTALREGIEEDPTYEEIFLLLVQLYIEELKVPALKELGEFYLEKKEYEKAEKCIHTALDYLPSSELMEQVLYLRGVLAFQRGDLSQAEEHLQLLANMGTHFAPQKSSLKLKGLACLLLGKIAWSHGDWQEAEINYKIAWGADPDSLEAAAELAYCYLQRKKYHELFSDYPLTLQRGKTFREEKNLFSTLFQAGYSEWNSYLRMVEIARDFLKHAESYAAHIGYAEDEESQRLKASFSPILRFLKEWLSTLVCLAEPLKKIPLTSSERLRLTLLYLSTQNLLLAQESLDILSREEKKPEVLRAQAELFLLQNQPQKVVELLQPLLTKPHLLEEKEQRNFSIYLAKSFMALGKPQEALSAYRKAVTESEKIDPEVHYQIALLLQDKESEQALEHLLLALCSEKQVLFLELLVSLLIQEKRLDEVELYSQAGLDMAEGHPSFLRKKSGSFFSRWLGKEEKGKFPLFPLVSLVKKEEEEELLEKLQTKDPLLRFTGKKAVLESRRESRRSSLALPILQEERGEDPQNPSMLNLSGLLAQDFQGTLLKQALTEKTLLTHLNLSDNFLDETKIHQVAEALKGHPTLISLDLSSTYIGDAVETIAQALQKCPSLRHLHLSHNQIGKRGIEALAEALIDKPMLQSLDLSHNPLGENLPVLPLGDKKYLTHLNCNHTALKDQGLHQLAQGLWGNKSLACLELKHNGITEKGIETLVSALSESTALREVHLGGNKLSIRGGEKLSSLLRTQLSLTTCDLSGNLIGEKGVVMLSEALFLHRALKSLNLSYNAYKSAPLLVEVLAHNPGLTTLNLEGNSLTPSVLTPLLHALKIAEKLQCLILNQNALGEEGALALAETLREKSSLETLSLRSTSLEGPFLLPLFEALTTCRSLKNLDLSGNPLSVQGARGLASFLEKTSSIVRLDLGGSRIGDEGLGPLALALGKHPRLLWLRLAENVLTAQAADALTPLLQLNPLLTSLDLEENQLGILGVKTLLKAAQTRTSSLALNCSKNSLNSTSIDDLIATLQGALEGTRPLLNLDLSHNDLGALGVAKLRQALAIGASPITLNLGSNG